uniref:Uncharacterized protein n=1 Tax=Haptolina ericina TaxID=156174 RepID=A0A7S3EWL2_9EUKA
MPMPSNPYAQLFAPPVILPAHMQPPNGASPTVAFIRQQLEWLQQQLDQLHGVETRPAAPTTPAAPAAPASPASPATPAATVGASPAASGGSCAGCSCSCCGSSSITSASEPEAAASRPAAAPAQAPAVVASSSAPSTLGGAEPSSPSPEDREELRRRRMERLSGSGTPLD